ncbi:MULTISPECIES: HmuY family protein [unclassified Tenacibaculum]|uniref:HmuY family protein n=1 Tax=unclassified Tenacibaculum TaxID=2635139 RepID=UPI001F184015|nr:MULTISPECIES: HmuY family protein [unclassified Tenacibaculum]MCF2873109.1 HmuY family protein [Tenacibaculum sp. Cn5-1]MCF2933265.1 HmuY family protein [Tenacibaculum sp. Cn5-34]MCG7510154.1 HmuY family protein [Tenacibaculum sp. Cn5-46]
MKQLKTLLVLAIISFVATSCSDNDTSVVKSVEAKTISNLYAPQVSDYTVTPPVISGDFTKFSFKEGKVVTGDNWDIAFRGLRVIVNGGSKYGLTDEPERTGNASLAVVNSEFSKVLMAPADSEFKQDGTGVYALPISGAGWYTYAAGVVKTNAGVIIVVKTIDGNYAKMEIKSYYKDLTSNEPRYYTFDYVYNPNVGDKSLK